MLVFSITWGQSEWLCSLYQRGIWLKWLRNTGLNSFVHFFKEICCFPPISPDHCTIPTTQRRGEYLGYTGLFSMDIFNYSVGFPQTLMTSESNGNETG